MSKPAFEFEKNDYLLSVDLSGMSPGVEIPNLPNPILATDSNKNYTATSSEKNQKHSELSAPEATWDSDEKVNLVKRVVNSIEKATFISELDKARLALLVRQDVLELSLRESLAKKAEVRPGPTRLSELSDDELSSRIHLLDMEAEDHNLKLLDDCINAESEVRAHLYLKSLADVAQKTNASPETYSELLKEVIQVVGPFVKARLIARGEEWSKNIDHDAMLYESGIRLVSSDIKDASNKIITDVRENGGQSSFRSDDFANIIASNVSESAMMAIDKLPRAIRTEPKKVLATLALVGILGVPIMDVLSSKDASASIKIPKDKIGLIEAAIEFGALEETHFELKGTELVIKGSSQDVLDSNVDTVEGMLGLSDSDGVSEHYRSNEEKQGNKKADQPDEVAPPKAPETTTPSNIDPETMNDQEYIDWLVSQINLTPDGYRAFSVDTSREDVFKDELGGRRIEPTAFVGHWTAGVYENGVDQFISTIKGREGGCCSVMYFIDRNGKTYRFVDSWEQTAHAYGANGFTQGAEIEAMELRGDNGYTPKQLESFLYVALRFMQANDIPIKRDRLLGHQEVDAEYGRKGKIDMPPELVDALFPKLLQLSEELKGEQVEPPETGNPEEVYNKTMQALLDEIASYEGGWDSVNRGKAGDTKLDSAAYKQVFGDRMLSDLTIREVIDLQQRRIIFAVGRYQIVRGTMASAVNVTKIDLDRQFDEAAQNELAINYLIMSKRPKLAAYIKGEADDLDAALLELAKEFASIPASNIHNDKMGRVRGSGFYDGDKAGNKATGGEARVEKITALINDLRSAYLLLHAPQPAPKNAPSADEGSSTTLSPPEEEGSGKDTKNRNDGNGGNIGTEPTNPTEGGTNSTPSTTPPTSTVDENDGNDNTDNDTSTTVVADGETDTADVSASDLSNVTIITSADVVEKQTIENAYDLIDKLIVDGKLSEEFEKSTRQKFIKLLGSERIPKTIDGVTDIDKLTVMFSSYLEGLINVTNKGE